MIICFNSILTSYLLISGPIETDMYKITTTQCCFPDVIENFRDLKTENRLVKVEDSIGKLINILKEQNYENGATIDYFDQ